MFYFDFDTTMTIFYSIFFILYMHDRHIVIV
jgi:hypothetical protein